MVRKPVIGVMGGAAADAGAEALAFELGQLIARRGWVLLNGGRNCGVMAASARGARGAGGTVIGILPDHDATAACPDLDFAVVTGLGDARNVINVLSSDVVVACPGGAGTLSEIALALKNNRHVVLLGIAMIPTLEPYRADGRLTVAGSPSEAVEQVSAVLAKRDSA